MSRYSGGAGTKANRTVAVPFRMVVQGTGETTMQMAATEGVVVAMSVVMAAEMEIAAATVEMLRLKWCSRELRR